jgi:hypothetical protein
VRAGPARLWNAGFAYPWSIEGLVKKGWVVGDTATPFVLAGLGLPRGNEYEAIYLESRRTQSAAWKSLKRSPSPHLREDRNHSCANHGAHSGQM